MNFVDVPEHTQAISIIYIYQVMGARYAEVSMNVGLVNDPIYNPDKFMNSRMVYELYLQQ